ncbi:MAG: histidine--tRNA ligase [Lachnospiraceae bacterium]|jgi:histidyl-tRNA synthetase
MKITPVKGTNDYLPQEAELRDYLQGRILSVYKENGFEHIVTPVVEDIENLDKSDGGDNLNLIFKILKRGEKLEKALDAGAKRENDLADMGLRYDLTLPLTRYYACHHDNLPNPVKCIQMDRVYRAERPQKGRLREFVQCDIDIFGSSSPDSEVELILTTTEALFAIGMQNFRVRINDRRLLRSFLRKLGFEEEQLDSVCISFDKLDKIGAEGVIEELKEKQFGEEAIARFSDYLNEGDFSLEKITGMLDDTAAADSVRYIIDKVNELSDGKFGIGFDLSLVRGQGYYTGTVFEIESIDFKGSIAGGGRYDNLAGKFLGKQVPAVGFSIGFERIFSILKDKGVKVPEAKKKIVVLYPEGKLTEAVTKARSLRQSGYIASLYVQPKKTGKFLNKMQEYGYDGVLFADKDEAPKLFSE